MKKDKKLKNTEKNAPDSQTPPEPQTLPQQPVRELSQTDHLNKRLLTSLFKSLDEGGEESLSKMMEPDTTDKIDEKEWEA
ncbi:hypothetical protein NE865_15140 [Phthorimaea operculella]|nr:hypothetical protein NE865_15140 [Phthorimaea operculella]